MLPDARTKIKITFLHYYIKKEPLRPFFYKCINSLTKLRIVRRFLVVDDGIVVHLVEAGAEEIRVLVG